MPLLRPSIRGSRAEIVQAALQAQRRVEFGSGREYLDLVGEPGSGKTTVLADIRRVLLSHGIPTRSIAVPAAWRALPLGLAGQIVRDIMTHWRPIVPAGGGSYVLAALAEMAPERSAAKERGRTQWRQRAATSLLVSSGRTPPRVAPRTVRALGELLVAATHHGSVALLLDDLQHADALSCDLLSSMAGAPGLAPLLLVSTRASASLGADGALAPAPLMLGASTRTLPLPALRATDVVDALAARGRLDRLAWSPAIVQGLATASHGSPLRLSLLLSWLASRGDLTCEDGRWECANPRALVTRLQGEDPVGEQMAELPEPALELLLVLTDAASPMTTAELCEATGWEAPVVVPAVRALSTGGLVVLDESGWCVRHPLVGKMAWEAVARLEGTRAAGADEAGDGRSGWAMRTGRRRVARAEIGGVGRVGRDRAVAGMMSSLGERLARVLGRRPPPGSFRAR